MVGVCDPSLPVSVIHIHGEDDDSIPIEGREDRDFPPVQEVVEAWSAFDRCRPRAALSTEGAASIMAWDECDSNTAVRFYSIEGVGHDYPRADQGDPVESRDLIVEFFAEHSRED